MEAEKSENLGLCSLVGNFKSGSKFSIYFHFRDRSLASLNITISITTDFPQLHDCPPYLDQTAPQPHLNHFFSMLSMSSDIFTNLSTICSINILNCEIQRSICHQDCQSHQLYIFLLSIMSSEQMQMR